MIASLSGCMIDPSVEVDTGVLDGIISDDTSEDDDPSESSIPSEIVSDGKADSEGESSEVSDVETGDKFDIALKMLQLQKLEDTDNIMMSPLSINMALSMAANTLGDSEASKVEEFLGQSIDEMNANSLEIINGANNPWSEQQSLMIENSLWIINKYFENINIDTLNTIKNNYNSDIQGIELDDVAKINSWVSEKTNGMIPKILDYLPNDFVSTIINALYFEDTWTTEFEEYDTEKEKFTRSDRSVVEVDMMHGTADSYMRNSQYEAFRKYYVGGYSFIGVVPLGDNQIDLSNMSIETLIESESNDYDVIISMPKFKFDYSTSLVDTLSSLGLGDIFKPTAVTKLVDGEKLRIGDIIHKTAIDMQESGTKAAAVTSVMTDNVTGFMDQRERKIKEVNLDKEFVFFIIDADNNIVFTGVVDNPEY